MLGLFQGGAIPSVMKATAEWFPQKERALVAGFCGAGTSIGATVPLFLVPWLLINYSWRWVFVFSAVAGCVWLVFWLWQYRDPAVHSRVSPEELEYIQSDSLETCTETIPWRHLFSYPQTWAFILAKFFSDSIVRWFLYFLPLFFSQSFGMDIKKIGLPFLVIFGMADLGSIIWGWASSRLIMLGWSVNAARKAVMLICAVCVLPVMFATGVENPWLAVLLVGLAAASHQGFACTTMTTVTDMFPKSTIGSVSGIGGAAGAVGGLTLLTLTGFVFKSQGLHGGGGGAFAILFTIVGTVYLIAFGCFHLLAPRLDPVICLPGNSASLEQPSKR